MADPYDPMKDPAKHAAPAKSLVDKVIELALGAGGGAVTLLSGLLAAVLILYSGYVLYDTFATERAASSNAWDLLQFKPEIFEDTEAPIAASGLTDVNEDYRAWLTVYDTAIDYPVVQGKNDLYYATHDIYKRTSLTGAIYMAAGNSPDFSDSYNVIYGHHMDSGAMFGALDHMTGQETGVIVTDSEIYDVQFFAVATTDAYEEEIYSVGNRMNDVLAFLRSGGEGGVGVGTNVTYFNEEALTDATKVVALSTCADAETSGRLVVFGTMKKHVVTVDLTVRKVWDDADDQDGMRPDSLTVTLSSGDTAELTEENNWTATLTVPKFDIRGEIPYTWAEETVTGYELVDTAYDEESRTTVLTNRHTPETTSVSVRKVWDDDENRDGLRPASVTAVLSDGSTVTLNEANGWTGTVEDLPVYDHGEPIEYTWTEKPVNGYELTVDGQTLTNTHTPARTTLTVSKVWNDGGNQDGIRPESVKVNLYGNDIPVGSVTLNEGNRWKGAVENLHVYEAGQPIEYRWSEEAVSGYTLSTAQNGTDTVLTNTHVPETVDLSVSKVWDDNGNQDGIRPRELRVDLSSGDFVTLNEGNGWSAGITGLPKYNAGVEIEYTWTEAEVPGYEQTGMVTREHKTVITNRHETDTTVATVIKVWDDDGNRDGIRPGSLTVTLSNGEERVLSAENDWTATVTGLPVNADGQPIPYTWSEPSVDGYTLSSSVDGTVTTLTNTHPIATVDLTVSKVWADGDNQDGIRPESLTVTLNANGEAAAAFTLNAANRWTVTAKDQPVYADGQPIEYSWTEEEISGYTLSTETSGHSTVLTNTHTPAVTSLTVVKKWEDHDNQDGIRPERLEVRLSNGDKVILSEENNWTATLEHLPVCAHGRAIHYTWTEEDVEGYTAVSSTAGTVTTLTNRHIPATVTLTVQKIWDDDHDRDRIRPSTLAVNLLADGTAVRSVALNAANHWKAAVEDLPVYENGKEIAYTWAEESVEGYELTVSADGTATVLTNTHAPASLALTVRKVWDDDDDRDALRPDRVTVTLRGDDTSERAVTLSEANHWTETVTVPVHDRGVPIHYTWSEENIPNYRGEQVTEENTTTFTNTHAPARTARTVTKIWDDADDQDGVRPETLMVSLLANHVPIETITLDAKDGWQYTAENLPVYEKGAAISYDWHEERVPGYPSAGKVNRGSETVFTNTHVPETATLSVTKVWDDAHDQDGMRPGSLTVILRANGKEAGRVELSDANDWTGEIPDLPVYANGRAIAYTWDEGELEGYTRSTVTFGFTTVITNTHETARTVATVIKAWDDDDNRDGIRPAKLTVTLSTGARVELTAENHWTGTVENLPKFRNGQEIRYSWTEEETKGYELIRTEADGTVTVLTNHHEIATSDRTVRKVWEDDDNRDGVRPDRLFVTVNNNQMVELNAENDWSGVVRDQPVYTDGGKLIIYSWREPAIGGYTLTDISTAGTETTLTNTHEPERISLTVVKVWEDNGDALKQRPESIRVKLSNGMTVVLSEENNWTATLRNLPRYRNGKPIVYTWTEPEILCYRQTDAVTNGTTTTLTNTMPGRPVRAEEPETFPGFSAANQVGDCFD